MDPKKILTRCWVLVAGCEIIISLLDHTLDFAEKLHRFIG